MRDFRNLQVWEKAHQLVLNVYKATDQFPKTEVYGITSQIRRAVVSVPANIAEGCGKDSTAETIRYFTIAMGSASELEYLLMLARDLDYLKMPQYHELSKSLVEVRRMLNSYTQKLKKTRDKQ